MSQKITDEIIKDKLSFDEFIQQGVLKEISN